MTKQSGYATKQTGYFWTKQLGLNSTYEDFTPDGDEHYIVSFPFIENEYHYDILLSFGDKCECLEPLHIRTEMQRRIQDMAAIYES